MIRINRLDELSGRQVYDFLLLRQSVFMLEQSCLYQDIDAEDASSWHLRYVDSQEALLGYLRILPPDRDSQPAIGRVAVKKKMRRKGIAREMMETALEHCQKLFPNQKIRISAQVYLVDFYTALGFQGVGPVYLEDDIPHQDMVFAQSS